MNRWVSFVLALAGCVVVAVGWGAPVARAEQPAAVSPAGPVVLLGVPDLRWQDVTEAGTPALWQLAGRSAIGAMTDRSGEDTARRATGWMTVNTGSRAVAFIDPASTVPDPGDPVQLARLEQINQLARYHSRVGALGDALRQAGRKVAAVNGGGAVLGGMTSDGTVDMRTSSVPSALQRGADVVIGELPQLYDVDRDDAAAVQGALSTIDTAIGTIVQQLPAGASLLVAGVSDGVGGQAHLHVAMAEGPRFGPGRLTSPSTGRDGVVQLIDVASTVLWLSDTPLPSALIGAPWQSVPEARIPTATEIARFVDLDERSVAQLNTHGYFRWVALVALLYVAITVACWARRRSGPPLLMSAAVAGVPAASWLIQLVPWWRIGTWTVAPLTAGVAILIGAAATFSPWPRDRRWRLAGVVGGISAAVITVDVATGSPLSLDAPFGDNPIIAGRFHGVGNVAFAVLAAGTLALAAASVSRMSGWRAAAVAFGLGAPAVVVDGYPRLGDDFGGVLSLLPGVALFGLIVCGVRISWRYVAAILGGTVATVATFVLVDYSRPASQQTHLGRFVGQIEDGSAWPVIMRKLGGSLGTVAQGWPRWIVLIWLLLALAFFLGQRRGWVRPADGVPPRTAGGLVAALVVVGVLGAVVNDSGLAITAFAFYVGAPLLVPLVEPLRTTVRAPHVLAQDAEQPLLAPASD
jgi:hypothetical protein